MQVLRSWCVGALCPVCQSVLSFAPSTCSESRPGYLAPVADELRHERDYLQHVAGGATSERTLWRAESAEV